MTDLEVHMESATEGRDRWRALGEPIKFTTKDFEVLDLTLCLVPDLRICALALKHARAVKVTYPIKSVEALIGHLENGQLIAGKHVIDADEIRTYVPHGVFPIEHEGALLAAVYAGLGRHRTEMAVLSATHPKTIDKFIAARRAQEPS
jgi:hypothetical protein